MSCGLELAQTALRDAPASFQKRLLVISDGHPTVGDTMPHNLNQMVDRLVGEDVVTSVLGLGRAVNEKLLADVANRGSGIYQFVRNSVVLDDALAAETNDFKAAVARDLAVALQVPPGVVVEEGSVRRVRNLRPGTPRRFLLRLQLPEGGWTGDLLTARAQWAGGDRQLALSSSVGRGLGGARNWAVTVEDVRAKNSAAMTASLEEASKGNPEEGERQLTRQIEGLPALMAKAPDWVRKDLGAEQREMIRLRKIVQVEAPTSVEVRGNFLYQQFRFNNISNGNPAQITPVFLQDSNEELE